MHSLCVRNTTLGALQLSAMVHDGLLSSTCVACLVGGGRVRSRGVAVSACKNERIYKKDRQVSCEGCLGIRGRVPALV